MQPIAAAPDLERTLNAQRPWLTPAAFDAGLGAMVGAKLLTTPDRQQAEAWALANGTDFFTALRRLGLCGEDALYGAVAQLLGWQLIDNINALPSATALFEGQSGLGIEVDWLVRQQVFCGLATDGTTARVYTSEPLNGDVLQAVLLLLPSSWQPELVLVTPAMISALSDEFVRERAVNDLLNHEYTNLAVLAEEAPVISLVNSILERAIQSDASDIHIEAGEHNMVVRFRVDGRLLEFMQQPRARFAAIASRIKLQSELDIAERRLPQDGRFTTRIAGKEYDVRVSTAPSVHGESIVLRLLPKQRGQLALNALGFAPDHLRLMQSWGALSNGIVLVTGPTGSGKSTTLYSLLDATKTGAEKIITVEDPVEYQLEGITQVQARPDIGYTFARALRSFLRQDPDIIMIGEIRDSETADIAVQSALTGHLVVSTLHTNDACAVFPRLDDIGVEPFMVAATVRGVQAQRLVRALCPHCAEPTEAPVLPIPIDIAESDACWRRPVGCERCHGQGYRGRLGIYELIPISRAMRDLVAHRADLESIRTQARKEGHRSLMEDGLQKAALGKTTVEEVLRVSNQEADET